jgi:starvation-inducible DNA-binding protein
MSTVISSLSIILADTYALFLKTQNYHWHVKGVHFKPFHMLFEEQYQALFLAIDEIAERILILGGKAPATFELFNQLKTIQDGDASLDANAMVRELAHDHGVLIHNIHKVMRMASDSYDEGSVALLSERIASHEKARWMLQTSVG